MDQTQHNAIWERRQAELWDRIFQATQDIVVLTDGLDTSAGGAILQEQMVKSAMEVGKFLVRATAAETGKDFQRYVYESRMRAIETDYWLRMVYMVQESEHVQQDVSGIISQYASIINLLQTMERHVRDSDHAAQHLKGQRVQL